MKVHPKAETFEATEKDLITMANASERLEGAQSIPLTDTQEIADVDFSRRVIHDVVGDLRDSFQAEGVSSDVLQLLEKLWVSKLQEAAEADPSVLEPPKAVNLGARPKTKKTKKIIQVDGPNDSSDSDDEVNDDEIGQVCHQLFLAMNWSVNGVGNQTWLF